MVWQFLVKNLDGKSHTVTFKPSHELYVSDLKAEVNKKLEIHPNDQRLTFGGGKNLEDHRRLSEYYTLTEPVLTTVFLVLRLPGGAAKPPFDPMIQRSLPWHLPKSKEKCSICYDGPALLMPCRCNRSICSTCLMSYVSHESMARSNICCTQCGSEWKLSVIKEYGNATNEEIESLATTLSCTAIRTDPTIGECPWCKCTCERKDTTNYRVRCTNCFKNGRKNPDFCWHCLHTWTGAGIAGKCGNSGCRSDILAQIQTAPMIEIYGVSCPSTRLCPKCNCAIEHKSGCKHMTCRVCKTEFCFICLRIKPNSGKWQCGSWNAKCIPAPKQTSVSKT